MRKLYEAYLCKFPEAKRFMIGRHGSSFVLSCRDFHPWELKDMGHKTAKGLTKVHEWRTRDQGLSLANWSNYKLKVYY